jgi:hypothetical protein
MDSFEAVTKIMCDAIERAEGWYCEILAQRHNGKNASEWAYDKLARIDREAMNAVEAYHRMTVNSMLDDTPRF